MERKEFLLLSVKNKLSVHVTVTRPSLGQLSPPPNTKRTPACYPVYTLKAS